MDVCSTQMADQATYTAPRTNPHSKTALLTFIARPGQITFHQYNERHDAIQALFMRLMGVDAPDVATNLDAAHAYIRAKVRNFRTYTSWGHDEAIIGGYYDAVLAKNALDNRGRPHVLDRFYTRQTNGVRFLDWFTEAITGKPVRGVACVDCETPEYHWTRPAFPQ
jgi:hypothetical protein